MANNTKEISAERLFDLLRSLSSFIDTPIRIYALGGTALTILRIKKSTLDIDINIETNKDYLYLCRVFEQIGFKKTGSLRWITQEGLAFDVFHGSNILGIQLLADSLNKSRFIMSFGTIELFTLSLQDIIISKLARGDNRDFEDIKDVLEKEKINIESLVQRYKETMQDSIAANYKQKLLDLIEIKFLEWKYPVNKKLIEDVKKWQS